MKNIFTEENLPKFKVFIDEIYERGYLCVMKMVLISTSRRIQNCMTP